MSNVLDVTDRTWEAVVLQSTTPVLVDFWAKWCGPCKAMAPLLDKLATEHQGRLKVVKLDIDESPEIAARHSIQSIPSFIIFKGGRDGKSVVGQMNYEKLKAVVEPYL